jgi:hypothetical protein
MYRNEVVAGDGEKRFVNVPADKQKACLEEVLSMLDNLDWIEDKAVLDKLPVIGSPAFTLRRAIYTSLLSAPYQCAMSDGVDTREFGFSECVDRIFDYTWKKPGRKLTKVQRMYQKEFVLAFLQMGSIPAPEGAYSTVSGFEWLPRAILNRGDLTTADIYAVLSRVNDVLKSRSRGASSLDKAHYQLLQSYISYGTSLK